MTKILLTNDDGWDAVGLRMLQRVVASFGDVWVVAPKHPMSGISHQITFEEPLELKSIGPRYYWLSGTPADCVRIGMTQLGVDFDWVLSGVNNGSNLGADIYVSGTVAAAREAVLHGRRALAISQYRRRFRQPFDWTDAEKNTHDVLGHLFEQAASGNRYHEGAWNINLPDTVHRVEKEHPASGPIAIIECPIDPLPLPTDFVKNEAGHFVPTSSYDARPRVPGSDVDHCFSGKITISPLPR